ncbi:MAG: TRL-like family protein, partial [Leptospiraceae bacterium]|nr:TRL-like family protein [Leptospiraceae bacterium]
MKKLIIVFGFLLIFNNCGPLNGALVTNTTYAGEYNQNNDVKSEKTAEGCQVSYLGLVGLGDAGAGSIA